MRTLLLGDAELSEELSFQVVFCKGKETGKKVPGTSDRTGQRLRPTVGPDLSPHCFSHFKNY